jgi:hypothetical protein
MFPVRYELNSYINLLRNSVFKGLSSEVLGSVSLAPGKIQWRIVVSTEVKSARLIKSSYLISCPAA